MLAIELGLYVGDGRLDGVNCPRAVSHHGLKNAVRNDSVSQPIRMDAPLGVNRPYNCTAVGKVLLADMPEEEFERLAADDAFEQRTERSITEADALRAEIEQARVQGWARDDEEYISGVGCVAVPVRDHEGQVIAALTVSGPAARISEKLDRLVAQVKARAVAISEEMGYRSPHK